MLAAAVPPRSTTGRCASGSTSSDGIPAAPARARRRSTASTTTTRTSPATTRRRTTPSAHNSSTPTSASPRSARRAAATSSSTSAPTTAPATWTSSGARVGEDQISYFGFSYGSELGAAWATLFPDTVRAMVIDGAADPDADPVESNLAAAARLRRRARHVPGAVQRGRGLRVQQPRRRRRRVRRADDATRRHADPERARPAPAQPRDGDGRGRPGDVPPVVLAGARPVAGRRPGRRRRRPAAVLRHVLPALAGRHVGQRARGVPRRSTAWTSRCARPSRRSTPRRPRSTRRRRAWCRPTRRAATRAASCRRPTDPRVEVTAAGAGPVVVIGTTGDPSTPFDSTRTMADKLEDGRLVAVDRQPAHGLRRQRVRDRRRQQVPGRPRAARRRPAPDGCLTACPDGCPDGVVALSGHRTLSATDASGGRGGI